jgi:aminopeptidase N
MDSVLFHGQKLTFLRVGNILTVQFPAALPAMVADSLAFFYQGEPTSTGFGSFEVNKHADEPILWTLSEPYGAMEWWPCKQALNDKIDSVDVFITHPAQYRAASNGVLRSETPSGGWTTAHWQHRFPIPAYLIAIAVTNYTVFSVPAVFDNDTTHILNYVYPESLAAAQTGVGENVDVLILFSDLFGPYPFQSEKYGHAQFGWGGGMEHQTMSFVGNFGYDLLAHELAHQWFGDKITCGSWQDIWLNEGFATYLTGLCYNFLRPQYWDIYKADRINKSTAQPDGSVWVDDTTTVARVFNSRLSYAKGSMLLHMLRWKMGDAAFFQTVRNYINDPALAFGYARTQDLKVHLEAVYGQNLDGFFADWFYGQGYPSYDIKWSKTPQNQVKIILGQTQSHPSVSFFEMPVAVKLKNSNQDTVLVLDNTFSGQEFSVQLGFAPKELIFDPDLWLVSRKNLVQEVLSTGEPLPEVSLEILPNPAHQQFTVRLKTTDNLDLRLSVWSADGKQVYVEKIFVTPGMNELPVNVGALTAGRYAVRLENPGWQVERAIYFH